MDTTTIHHTESLTERMIAAYLDGAESGMIDARGYGLTAEERASAELEASALYGESETAAA